MPQYKFGWVEFAEAKEIGIFHLFPCISWKRTAFCKIVRNKEKALSPVFQLNSVMELSA